MQEQKSPNGHFSGRLEKMMRDQSLSGADLARITGLTPTAISRYRQGRIPAADELHRLSRALGVSMEQLLTGEGPVPPGGPAAPTGALKEAARSAEALAKKLREAEGELSRLRSFLG